MIYLIIYLIVFAFTVSTAYIDADHIINGQYIHNHKPRFIQRFLAILPILLFDWKIGIASALLFWILFDHILNIFRGRNFFYLGTVSKFDRFFSKRKTLYFILKLLAYAISQYLLISKILENNK